MVEEGGRLDDWTIGQLDMEEKKKVVDMEREEEEEMEKDWKEG